jgi:hypothetical protein
MAIPSAAVWEIRDTGDDSNGGFYSSGGTDYSQQDSPILSLSDVVTNGTTTVTSAIGGFTSAMIGNGINIAGTIYQITARASSTSITVDRNAASGTGQTAKIGGALLSLGKAAGYWVAFNDVWCKGVLTILVNTENVAGGWIHVYVANLKISGYSTTRGDKGFATLRATVASGTVPYLIKGDGASYLQVHRLILDTNSKASQPFEGGNGTAQMLRNCVFIGGSITNVNNGVAEECKFVNCSTNIPIHSWCVGWGNVVFGGFTTHCILYGNGSNTGYGMTGNLTHTHSTAYNCSCGFDDNTGSGPRTFNCVAVNCLKAFFFGTTTLSNRGCHIVNCAEYGSTIGTFPVVNATVINSTSLSAFPFDFTLISALTADSPIEDFWAAFTPNSTPGGGLLLRASGMAPYSDRGAIQHADVGTGTKAFAF